MLHIVVFFIGVGFGAGGVYLSQYLFKLEQERNKVNLDMGEILRWKNEIEKNKK